MRGWLSKVTAGNKRRDEGYGPTATGGGNSYGRGPGGMMMGHQQRSGANAGEELVKAQLITRYSHVTRMTNADGECQTQWSHGTG